MEKLAKDVVDLKTGKKAAVDQPADIAADEARGRISSDPNLVNSFFGGDKKKADELQNRPTSKERESKSHSKYNKLMTMIGGKRVTESKKQSDTRSTDQKIRDALNDQKDTSPYATQRDNTGVGGGVRRDEQVDKKYRDALGRQQQDEGAGGRRPSIDDLPISAETKMQAKVAQAEELKRRADIQQRATDVYRQAHGDEIANLSDEFDRRHGEDAPNWPAERIPGSNRIISHLGTDEQGRQFLHAGESKHSRSAHRFVVQRDAAGKQQIIHLPGKPQEHHLTDYEDDDQKVAATPENAMAAYRQSLENDRGKSAAQTAVRASSFWRAAKGKEAKERATAHHKDFDVPRGPFTHHRGHDEIHVHGKFGEHKNKNYTYVRPAGQEKYYPSYTMSYGGTHREQPVDDKEESTHRQIWHNVIKRDPRHADRELGHSSELPEKEPPAPPNGGLKLMKSGDGSGDGLGRLLGTIRKHLSGPRAPQGEPPYTDQQFNDKLTQIQRPSSAPRIELQPHPEDVIDVDPEIIDNMNARLKPTDLKKAAGPSEKIREIKEKNRPAQELSLAQKIAKIKDSHNKLKVSKDALNKSEDLKKRSKNVREQTRNLGPGQAESRRAQYARSIGLEPRKKNKSKKEFPDKAEGNKLKYGGNFSIGHETAHAVSTPENTSIADYQTKLGDTPSSHAAENITGRLENLIDRRAGVGGDTFFPNAHVTLRNKESKPLDTKKLRAYNAAYPNNDKIDDHALELGYKGKLLNNGFDAFTPGNNPISLNAKFKGFADSIMAKFDQGRRFNKHGRPIDPDDVHAKINRRSAQPLKKDAKIERENVFGNDHQPARMSDMRIKMMRHIKAIVKDQLGLDLETAQGKIDPSTGKLHTPVSELPIHEKPYDPYTDKGVADEHKRLAEIKAMNAGKTPAPKPAPGAAAGVIQKMRRAHKAAGNAVTRRMDPKPDWRSGKLQSQPSPDAAIHEIAHLLLSPEGHGLGQTQEEMDHQFGQVIANIGFLKQKMTQGEIQPMAVENKIRRTMGLPANDERFDKFQRGEIEFHPERGWVPATNVNAKINQRARAASEDPNPDTYFARKDKDTLMRSEDAVDGGEALEKRSKNVREQTRNLSPEKRKQRISRFIRKLGFTNRESTQDRFGVGENQRELLHTRNAGSAEHELAHALEAPVGTTLREHQKALGQVTSQVGMPQEERIERETTAFNMQPGIARRAGVDTRLSQHRAALKQTSPSRQRANSELEAIDEGRKVITPKGAVMAGTSVNAKINARAKPLEKAKVDESMSPKGKRLERDQRRIEASELKSKAGNKMKAMRDKMAKKTEDKLQKSDIRPKEEKQPAPDMTNKTDVAEEVVHMGKPTTAKAFFSKMKKKTDKMDKMTAQPLAKANEHQPHPGPSEPEWAKDKRPPPKEDKSAAEPMKKAAQSLDPVKVIDGKTSTGKNISAKGLAHDTDWSPLDHLEASGAHRRAADQLAKLPGKQSKDRAAFHHAVSRQHHAKAQEVHAQAGEKAAALKKDTPAGVGAQVSGANSGGNGFGGGMMDSIGGALSNAAGAAKEFVTGGGSVQGGAIAQSAGKAMGKSTAHGTEALDSANAGPGTPAGNRLQKAVRSIGTHQHEGGQTHLMAATASHARHLPGYHAEVAGASAMTHDQSTWPKDAHSVIQSAASGGYPRVIFHEPGKAKVANQSTMKPLEKAAGAPAAPTPNMPKMPPLGHMPKMPGIKAPPPPKPPGSPTIPKMAKAYEGFKKVEASAKASGARDPAAVAGAAGMKKYGKQKMEEAAHKGEKLGKGDVIPIRKPTSIPDSAPHNPHHRTLLAHGFKHVSTTTAQHGNGQSVMHNYARDGHAVGVSQNPKTFRWEWESKKNGSGFGGFGDASLKLHLAKSWPVPGLVPPHHADQPAGVGSMKKADTTNDASGDYEQRPSSDQLHAHHTERAAFHHRQANEAEMGASQHDDPRHNERMAGEHRRFAKHHELLAQKHGPKLNKSDPVRGPGQGSGFPSSYGAPKGIDAGKKASAPDTQLVPNDAHLWKSEGLEKHVPGVPDKKFDSCVSQVKAKGTGNAYAICTSALKKCMGAMRASKMTKSVPNDGGSEAGDNGSLDIDTPTPMS